MRKNIIDKLSKLKNISNVVIFTHNIDFLFLQTVVASTLRKVGNPKILIFAEKSCVYEAYNRQSLFLDSIGTKFRIIPVSMKSGFRFHPKLIMATGKDSAHLINGSGNLTFGGWSENGEIWEEFDNYSEASGNFTLVSQEVEKLIHSHPSKENLKVFLNETISSEYDWVSALSENTSLLIRNENQESLLEKIEDIISDFKIKEVDIIAPYFDYEGKTIEMIKELFSPQTLNIYVPLKGSNLSKKAYEKVKSYAIIKSTSYEVKTEDAVKSNFIHAKLFCFKTKDVVHVFSGSANCSFAALLAKGETGNYETLTYKTMSLEVYKELILSELKVTDGIPELEENDPDNQEKSEIEEVYTCNISSAIYEYGNLKVSFMCSSLINGLGLLINDTEYLLNNNENNVFNIPLTYAPRSVQVIYELDGNQHYSDPHWVDNEVILTANLSALNFSSKIKDCVTELNWGPASYFEIVKAFNENIKHMSKVTRSKISLPSDKQENITEFTEQDIFTSSFSLEKIKYEDISYSTKRITSLNNLISAWFGLEGAVNQNSTEDEIDDESDNAELNIEKAPSLKKRKLKNNDFSLKISKQITGIYLQFKDESYFKSRSPERFVADIKICSLLLRTGLKEKWISEDDFFQVTCEIWSSLFFSCNLDKSIGWIEYYLNNSEDKPNAISRMKSDELTTAMGLWVFSVQQLDSPFYSTFKLASYLSVSKHSWMWSVENKNLFLETLSKAIVTVDKLGAKQFEKFKEQFPLDWSNFRKKGYSLNRLEKILEKYKVAELAAFASPKVIQTGDLLWQGSLGFGISLESKEIRSDSKVKILTPQSDKQERTIVAKLMVPLRLVVNSGKLEELNDLNDNLKSSILELVEELTSLKFV